MTTSRPASFHVAEHAAAAVVEAHGDLDLASAEEFRATLQRAVDTEHPVVVVDLADVSFLDSAALSVVFRAKRALPVSRRMVLANVPARMRGTLRLSGVHTVVELHTPGEPEPWLETP